MSLVGAAPAFAASLAFLSPEGAPRIIQDEAVNEPAAALEALARAPAYGASSAIPHGTRVLAYSQAQGEAIVEFSGEILSEGLDDLRLEAMAAQARLTLAPFGVSGGIRLQTAGRLLSDYLPSKPREAASARVAPLAAAPAAGGALAGKSISLSPGHGKVWTGSSYTFERPVYCAPLNREDDHNVEGMIYLNQYLAQDGAVTKVYRCLDKNYGTHTPSGEPWWRISSSYWLKLQGYPCSVYASSTGDCNLGVGASEGNDSLRSRGLASDYDKTDIYVSLHSNGFQGDCSTASCPNGTCTYYDTSTEHAPWGAISKTLANKVNASILNAIRTRYGDSTWMDRGSIDANGSQAETRIPDRAAILIELAFHDSCLRDAVYLHDNFFKSTTMWAAYKGICDYFGVTPGWDYYSCELVSDDLPPVLQPGATVTARITMRNRGVLWNDARNFRLGAVGDSDPFTTTTRHNVGGEIGPGQTKTFTLTLKAPLVEGVYTTDWRMMREGAGWFGPTLARNILVSRDGDTQPPSVPTGLLVTAPEHTRVDLRWNASTDNVGVSGYRIYRDGRLLGSTNTTAYSDLTTAAWTTYSYQIAAFDASGNESARSLAAQITTPAQLDFILDNIAGTASGDWTTGTASADKYLTDYVFKSTEARQTGYFRWTPRIQQPGFYNLYVWYPQGANRCTNAAYTVQYAGGGAVVPVNQTAGGGGWVSLGGPRPFISGSNGWIQLGNESVEPAKVVIADAVRFTFAGALPSLPALQQALVGKQMRLTWSNPYCVLQRATSLTGSEANWTDMPGVRSPFVLDTTGEPRQFYRLRY